VNLRSAYLSECVNALILHPPQRLLRQLIQSQCAADATDKHSFCFEDGVNQRDIRFAEVARRRAFMKDWSTRLREEIATG
jgi:hypothetical protein